MCETYHAAIQCRTPEENVRELYTVDANLCHDQVVAEYWHININIYILSQGN